MTGHKIAPYTKKPVDGEKIKKAILESSVSTLFKGMTYDDGGDGELIIYTTEEPTASQMQVFDQIVEDHDGTTPDPTLDYKKKVLQVMEQGMELIAEFGAENVVMGLSAEQMGGLVQAYAPVIGLLQTGSGYLARDTFAMIPANEAIGMPQDRKDRYINKMNAMLAAL